MFCKNHRINQNGIGSNYILVDNQSSKSIVRNADDLLIQTRDKLKKKNNRFVDFRRDFTRY